MNETHTQIGALYVVLGVIFAAMSTIPILSLIESGTNGVGAALALAAFGGLQIWGGVALRRGSERGRAAVQVFAVLYVASVSLLSVVGGLTLWLLYRSQRSHAV